MLFSETKVAMRLVKSREVTKKPCFIIGAKISDLAGILHILESLFDDVKTFFKRIYLGSKIFAVPLIGHQVFRRHNLDCWAHNRA